MDDLAIFRWWKSSIHRLFPNIGVGGYRTAGLCGLETIDEMLVKDKHN